MKNSFIITIVFFLFSCQEKKKNLEIILLNKDLLSYDYQSKKDTINVIYYKVFNPTNYIYYINNDIDDQKLNVKSAYKGGRFLRIFNLKTKKETDYFTIPAIRNNIGEICAYERLNNILIDSKRLQYKEPKRYFYSKEGCQNFFIHPNETIFFEYYLNLTDTIPKENFRGGYAGLKYGISYFSKLSIASDSSNYKNVLPKDILQTIKANNVKVYHGIIESKNSVPVKVID